MNDALRILQWKRKEEKNRKSTTGCRTEDDRNVISIYIYREFYQVYFSLTMYF